MIIGMFHKIESNLYKQICKCSIQLCAGGPLSLGRESNPITLSQAEIINKCSRKQWQLCAM